VISEIPNPKSKIQNYFALGLIAVLFLALLFAIQSVLTPFVIILMFFIFGWPLRNVAGVRSLLWAGGIAFVLWFLYHARVVFAPFVLGALLAYLLNPLVDLLVRWKVRRSLAILFWVVAILGALGLAFSWILPLLFAQVGALISRIPYYFEITKEKAGYLLTRFNVPVDRDRIVQEVLKRWEMILGKVFTGLSTVGRGIGFLLSVVSFLIITPIVTLLFLGEWPKFKAGILKLIPERYREGSTSLYREVDAIVGRYIRGQLTVCALDAVLMSTSLTLLGIDYSLLLGFWAGLFQAIPNIGFVIGMLPALIVAAFAPHPVLTMLKVLGAFVAVNLIEGNLTTPRIMGKSLGLHPLWVMLGLMLGALFFGFVGLLVATPVVAVLKVLFGKVQERYLASELYKGKPATPPS
jgi:predicted PurR-regulated permease PerM